MRRRATPSGFLPQDGNVRLVVQGPHRLDCPPDRAKRAPTCPIPCSLIHNMVRPRIDPAERSGYLRYFYRRWRPTRFGRIWSKAWAWIIGLGMGPGILLTLQVKDRSGDRLHATVLVVATYQGQRYLVSMLGEGSEWVRNVRAAQGRAFIKRGRSHPVILAELPVQERAAILKAWCQVATSGRQHLPVSYEAPISAFEPIASDYPVFRIDPAQRERTADRGQD